MMEGGAISDEGITKCQLDQATFEERSRISEKAGSLDFQRKTVKYKDSDTVCS